jgi:hypothetical protein
MSGLEVANRRWPVFIPLSSTLFCSVFLLYNTYQMPRDPSNIKRKTVEKCNPSVWDIV